MKKLLMALILSLAVSTSCFAAGVSGRFAAEEKAADALVAALIGNGGTYEQVSKSFSQPFKAKYTAEQFDSLKKEIKSKVGKIKNPNFVQLIKEYSFQKGYNGTDVLIYLGAIDSEKCARVAIVFSEENNAPKVVSIHVAPIALQQNGSTKQEASNK